MQRTIIYILVGTGISFLLNHFILGSLGWQIDLYHAMAFGLGWGLAYFVDRPEWALSKKMGISLVGVALIVLIGLMLFNFETAVPSIIKFSTVFVAYYMIASFRARKSLRK